MTTDPTHLAGEVASQPEDWRQILRRVDEARAVLPQSGQSAAVIGCGTSYYMAQAYAALRESRGAGRTDAYPASEFPLDRSVDRVVAVSRSGTTTEVVELVDTLRQRGVPTTAIVATSDTPVLGLVSASLVLPEVDEESVVQTRFATTTLALLRATLGEDLAVAIGEAEDVLAEDENSAVGELAALEQITFLGRGWSVGLAAEAALKLRESCQLWTESYPALEYRHGPISIAAPGRGVWALGEVPAGLAEEVAATGAHFVHHDIDPLAELVRVHRLCLVKSAAAGLDPDRPRNLTRSVILH